MLFWHIFRKLGAGGYGKVYLVSKNYDRTQLFAAKYQKLTDKYAKQAVSVSQEGYNPTAPYRLCLVNMFTRHSIEFRCEQKSRY